MTALIDSGFLYATLDAGDKNHKRCQDTLANLTDDLLLPTVVLTVVILGDGRNNYNSPRIDLMKDLQRRARKLVWFNPETPRQWGTGDSDMLDYYPLCDAVHVVRNLAQLSSAIDKLFIDG